MGIPIYMLFVEFSYVFKNTVFIKKIEITVKLVFHWTGKFLCDTDLVTNIRNVFIFKKFKKIFITILKIQ